MYAVVKGFAGRWQLMISALQMSGIQPFLCLENAYRALEVPVCISQR